MNIIPPFKEIDEALVNEFLKEKNVTPRFSPTQKAYYGYMRRFIPAFVRRKLQYYRLNRIRYKENFIQEELINILKDRRPASDAFHSLYPKNETACIILTHDVEEEEGFRFIPKVIELEASYGFRSSWNIVPYKYKIDDGIINFINSQGHEVGIHGYNHDGKLYYSENIFRERVPFINTALHKYHAVGFRSPMVHRNLQWLQMLEIEYDSSFFDYDPFQQFPGGTGSIWPFIAGRFTELPYTLPQDHTLFYVLRQKDISIWMNKINWIIQNHGVVLSLTHPDYLIRSDHFRLYEELLKYLVEIPDTWHCLPKEVSRWWSNKYTHTRSIN